MHKSDMENFFEFQPLHICHYAFEPRKKSVTDKVIQCLIKKQACFNVNDEIRDVSWLDHPLSAHDCATILYMISNMQEYHDLVIDYSNSGVRVKQLEELADILASKLGKLQVASLNLHGNKLSDKSVSNIFKTALAGFCLTDLDLGDNKISDSSVDAITKMLEKSCCKNLSSLILSHNPLTISSLQTLEGAIRSGSLINLVCLHLQRSFKETSGTLSAIASLPDLNQESKARAIFNSFLDALSDHCPKSEVVDLSNNDFQISVAGAIALAKIASRKTRKCSIKWNTRSFICNHS